MIKLEHIVDKIHLLKLLQQDNIFLNIVGIDEVAELQNSVTINGWFQAIEHDNVIGIINIKHFSGNCFLFHAGVYKEFRGPKSERYLKEILMQLKEISPAAKFIATVNENNKLAEKYLIRAGFTKSAIIPNGASNNKNLLIFVESI